MENNRQFIDNALIKKRTIAAGKKCIDYQPGTRVKFHFETRKATDGTLIDDSRSMGKPMELVLGKKFKLEVWEVIVQKMALDEISKFVVDKSLVAQYPFISKTLRDIGKQPCERRHCCSMTLQNEGIGYRDLDDLFKNPCDLEFTIHLYSVELPEQYEKDRWQMTDEEKLSAITKLKERGNQQYKERNLIDAEESYRQAIGIIEQLMIKEKPQDSEWLELAALKIPLLLNYAQCRLIDRDYYAVIEHCNEILNLDPRNVKAYYRRAKAHTGAWNPSDAKKDYEKVIALEPSLKQSVAKELKAIDAEIRMRDLQDKMKMQKLF